MRITFIFHSGFAIETASSIIVFDFWMDPASQMDRLIASPKRMYVLSSHFHEDHFSRAVFSWKERRKGKDTIYILSKDILRHRRAERGDADAYIAKGGIWEDGNVRITASGSTDSGVSWIVETEGRRIFHAGDLNSWYARFLDSTRPGETVISEETGETVDPWKEEKRYLGELKDIRKIAASFDVVFFPVDSRIGNGYTHGARAFIERFPTGLLVPMHFTAGGAESAWRMKESADALGTGFWKITTEGEQIEIP